MAIADLGAYIIEVKILTGERAGAVYYQQKGGYITDKEANFFRWETYTLRTAKMVCNKLDKINARTHANSASDAEYRKAHGIKAGYVVPREAYKPYRLDEEKVFGGV